MVGAIFGLVVGVFVTWVWLTEGSPKARKDNHQTGVVQVRCSHCGQMNWVSYNNVRVDTKCPKCA